MSNYEYRMTKGFLGNLSTSCEVRGLLLEGGQAGADSVLGKLCNAVQVQLFHDVLAVSFDGGNTDVEE